MKVYCKNCRYFIYSSHLQNTYPQYGCNFIKNLHYKKGYYHEASAYQPAYNESGEWIPANALKINKENNCSDFKQKKWWHKKMRIKEILDLYYQE